jgi:hypothetical protein
MTELQKTVDELLKKAAASDKSEDAVRFAQAALNAAHTHHALVDHPQKG